MGKRVEMNIFRLLLFLGLLFLNNCKGDINMTDEVVNKIISNPSYQFETDLIKKIVQINKDDTFSNDDPMVMQYKLITMKYEYVGEIQILKIFFVKRYWNFLYKDHIFFPLGNKVKEMNDYDEINNFIALTQTRLKNERDVIEYVTLIESLFNDLLVLRDNEEFNKLIKNSDDSLQEWMASIEPDFRIPTEIYSPPKVFYKDYKRPPVIARSNIPIIKPYVQKTSKQYRITYYSVQEFIPTRVWKKQMVISENGIFEKISIDEFLIGVK